MQLRSPKALIKLYRNILDIKLNSVKYRNEKYLIQNCVRNNIFNKKNYAHYVLYLIFRIKRMFYRRLGQLIIVFCHQSSRLVNLRLNVKKSPRKYLILQNKQFLLGPQPNDKLITLQTLYNISNPLRTNHIH